VLANANEDDLNERALHYFEDESKNSLSSNFKDTPPKLSENISVPELSITNESHLIKIKV